MYAWNLNYRFYIKSCLHEELIPMVCKESLSLKSLSPYSLDNKGKPYLWVVTEGELHFEEKLDQMDDKSTSR